LHEAKEFYKDHEVYGATKLLVSPAMLINPDDISETDKERLQPLVESYKDLEYKLDDLIPARKTEEAYELIDGIDKVKAAFLAKVPYVQIKAEK